MRFVVVALLSLVTVGTAFGEAPKVEYVTRKYVDTHKCEIRFQDQTLSISKADLTEDEAAAKKALYESRLIGTTAAYFSVSESDGDQFLKLVVYQGTGLLNSVSMKLSFSGVGAEFHSAVRLGGATVKLESGKVDLIVHPSKGDDIRLVCQ